jgi:hypothetical protein
MTKRIEHDLFARLMRLSARERKDILEFLGQSPVSAGDLGGCSALTDRVQEPPEPGAAAAIRPVRP